MSVDIRNLALVGHSGAGKTLLAEALLLEAGAIRAKGNLTRGSTVCDFDPQEKSLQHSLDSAVCSFEAQGTRINLIDTPGMPDFLGHALGVLEAVETAVVVVNAANGIEPVTQRMMDFARERELCRLIVVNRIDGKDARPLEVLEELRVQFGAECLPLNLPSEDRTGVLDCFFEPDPALAAAHTRIVDQVVELDERLMTLYLEQGESLTPDQLHDPFEQALRDGHLIPVCFTSAETGAGIAQLLHIVRRLMPNPAEGNPPPFLKGTGAEAVRVAVTPDPAAHLIAHVFKISVDPFVGKLGIARIHQGTLRSGAALFVGETRKPVKAAHLYRLLGKEHVEIPSAAPGEICALAKIEELHLDAVLHDSHEEDHFHLKPISYPPPMFGVAIEPQRRGEEQRLSEALHKLTAEDPCVRVGHDAALNETVLYGMGELHLRVLLERMSGRYNVHVQTHPPSVPYRETVTRPAEGHCRHKKQTGGAGQFGEVFLRVEPLARGAGFEFVDEVVGGAIPGPFIPAVEKGVRRALAEGVIAGFPVHDVRVTVHDGKHHPVDSKEVAFISAGRKALLDAVHKATPIVLEPLMRVEIVAPATTMGDITGDLAVRRGRIGSNTTLPRGRVSIEALVPLAELNEYTTRLKALTGGEGSYSMSLSHYDPTPPKKQQELIRAHRPRENEDG